MKKCFLFVTLILTSHFLFGQKFKNGIGLRIGEPIGGTYKKYLSGDRAIEFGLGTGALRWSDRYYENSFDRYSKYKNYNYRGHSIANVIYLQARYLLHNGIHIEGMEGKLDWYWGIGAVLKTASIDYRYREQLAPFTEYRDRYVDFDFGPEGIIGLEYVFQDIPLTAFGEVSLMVELANRPGIFRLFSGVGLRYNF